VHIAAIASDLRRKGKKEELRLKKISPFENPRGEGTIVPSTMKIMIRQFLQSKDSLSWDNSKSVRISSYQPHVLYDEAAK